MCQAHGLHQPRRSYVLLCSHTWATLYQPYSHCTLFGCEANPSPLLTMRILTRSIAQHLRCDTQAANMTASHLASEVERLKAWIGIGKGIGE